MKGELQGYLDVKITVGTLGGHSSVPPSHSAIGIMGKIASAIEDSPWAPSFSGSTDPFAQFLACGAQHGKYFPKTWRGLMEKGEWDELAEGFAESGKFQKALVTTTQAIDVIHGGKSFFLRANSNQPIKTDRNRFGKPKTGQKVNALPEFVTLLLNHRIAFSKSIPIVQSHLESLIAPLSENLNLTLFGFSDTTPVEERGDFWIKFETFGEPLEVAPRSPTTGGVWELFAGTIRGSVDGGKQGMPVVTPFASTGNTDTSVYHAMSKSIFVSSQTQIT